MSHPVLTDIQNAPHQLPKKLTRQEKFFLGEIKNIAAARLVLPVLGNVDAVQTTAASLCPSCKRYCMQNQKVQLIPCQDEICLECHLMESGKSSVSCACCKEPVFGHCVRRLVGQNLLESSRITYPTPSASLDLRAHPDKIKDPYRNLCLELQSLGSDEKIGRGVLFYSKYIGRGKFCILTSPFNRKTGFLGNDSSFVSLKRIFSQLKADTIDAVPYDKTSTALHPREFKNYLLRSDDQIRDLCYCISTGEDIDEAIVLSTPRNLSIPSATMPKELQLWNAAILHLCVRKAY